MVNKKILAQQAKTLIFHLEVIIQEEFQVNDL